MSWTDSAAFSVGIALTALCAASANAAPKADPLGKFRNTHYYAVFEEDFSGEVKTESVLTMEGSVLALVAPKFYTNLLMEGTGILLDKRVVNWAGKVEGKSRYHITEHPWGRGTGSCALVPFHTIAADPAQIPPGAVVRIGETVGMPLPDGSRHDGVWRAEDTGSAILHDRIDLFIGKKSNSFFLTRSGIGHMQALTVTVLEQPLPDSCVYQAPR